MNDINASVKIDWEMHMAAPLLSDIWETHHRKASTRRQPLQSLVNTVVT